MKAGEFSVEAKNLEQVKVVFPKSKREEVTSYLHGNGWWVARSGDGKDHGTMYMLAVREESTHATTELLDEVNFGLCKL